MTTTTMFVKSAAGSQRGGCGAGSCSACQRIEAASVLVMYWLRLTSSRSAASASSVCSDCGMRSISRPLWAGLGLCARVPARLGAPAFWLRCRGLPSSSARSLASAAFVRRASALCETPSSSATSRRLSSRTKRRYRIRRSVSSRLLKAPASRRRDSLASNSASRSSSGAARLGRPLALSRLGRSCGDTPTSRASSVGVGARFSRAVSSSRAPGSRTLASWRRRGRRTGPVRSRIWRFISPSTVGTAKATNSSPRFGSKRSIAFSRPIEPACTRSSCSAPRLSCLRARASTSGMYSSTRRSRARASPCW